MSSTLSMTTMVQKLQYKVPIGIPDTTCVNFVNEAFRKVNQMSKGGFIWQFTSTGINVPPGASFPIAMPADFDPGKTSILRGNPTTGFGATATMIPYLPMKDFVNQEHFQTAPPNFFACWTFVPVFTQPTAFPFNMILGPATAYPTTGGVLLFFYHSVNFQPVPLGSSNYFPSPDQFDSMIVDLAIADAQEVYSYQDGGMKRRQDAMQAIAEIIDTYRTDRYDLAGITDQMAQAQEKKVEQAK